MMQTYQAPVATAQRRRRPTRYNDKEVLKVNDVKTNSRVLKRVLVCPVA